MRWTAIVAFVGALSSGRAEAAIKVHGAAIDDTAKKVGENRFRSAEDWEKTVRFFRGIYGGKPGIVWSTLETPPKVKAVHIANTAAKRTWDGINVYEVNGDVFIFVIAADPATKG